MIEDLFMFPWEDLVIRYLIHIKGEAIEQAYAALYLASDESSFVTGTEFNVDGGITAGM